MIGSSGESSVGAVEVSTGETKKFEAAYKDKVTGERVSIGWFDSEREAMEAYKLAMGRPNS